MIRLVALEPGAMIARCAARQPHLHGSVFRPVTLTEALGEAGPAVLVVNGQHLSSVTERLGAWLARPGIRAGLQRRFALVIDASGEGYAMVPEYLDEWHALFDAHGIPPGRVAYVTHNEHAPAALRAWLRESGRAAGLRVLLHHPILQLQADWVRRAQGDPMARQRRLRDVLNAPAAVAAKSRLLCLNNKPHAHRLVVAGRILRGGLARHTLLSLGAATRGVAEAPFAPFIDEAREVLPRFAADLDALAERLPDLPMTIPGDARHDVVYAMPDALYGRALMSLVAETNFAQPGIERFTEKSAKALAAGHPVILAALPGTLRLLRGAGFATFDPYVDEGYDGITDPQDRLDAVLAEAARIADLPDAACAALLRRCLPAMEHNMRHAAEGLPALMQRRLAEFAQALAWMAEPAA